MRSSISALESLNEQKDTYIQRLNAECEMHAEINAELRVGIESAKLAREMANTRNRAKNGMLVKLYRRIRSAEIEVEDCNATIEYQRGVIFDRNAAIRGYSNELNSVIGTVRKQDARISRLVRTVKFLKSRISRMEKRICTVENVADEYESLTQYWRGQYENRGCLIRSYEKTISEQDDEIRALKTQIEAMISTPDEIDEIPSCEVIIDFQANPEIIGIAPCGNGCPVKRDIAGRDYDAHEKTCEFSDEFSGLDF